MVGICVVHRNIGHPFMTWLPWMYKLRSQGWKWKKKLRSSIYCEKVKSFQFNVWKHTEAVLSKSSLMQKMHFHYQILLPTFSEKWYHLQDFDVASYKGLSFQAYQVYFIYLKTFLLDLIMWAISDDTCVRLFNRFQHPNGKKERSSNKMSAKSLA